MNNQESTYALLVRSEDKNLDRVEVLVYALFILSAVFSIWQAAHQSVTFPTDRVTTAPMSVVDTHRS